MSITTPELARTATPDASSPAFLKAVTQLGRTRSVVTARAIFNQQGVKLLEGGVQIDATLYDRLVSHRLSAPLDESVGSDAPVRASDLREAAEAALTRWPFFAQMAPAGRVRGMLLQALESIPLPRPIAFHLTLAREIQPAQFEHAVLMALLCAHLVREGGAPIHDMTVAASAGLLHDLGMLHIDADTLAADHQLSGEERRPLYAHPVTASMLVARFPEYPRQVARAILEHHERIDGSGYPRGLAGEAISPLGRMLSLCEVVTAMFDGAREHPEQRVSLLLRLSPRRYDAALVPSIHRLLRAMPVVRDEVGVTAADSVARLRVLADLHAAFLGATQSAATGLDSAAQAVLVAVAEQARALQRSLTEAGIAPEQFDLLVDGDDADAGLRGELWALTRELLWHLRATANQLRRRWRAGTAGRPFPAEVAGWLDAVNALED